MAALGYQIYLITVDENPCQSHLQKMPNSPRVWAYDTQSRYMYTQATGTMSAQHAESLIDIAGFAIFSI